MNLCHLFATPSDRSSILPAPEDHFRTAAPDLTWIASERDLAAIAVRPRRPSRATFCATRSRRVSCRALLAMSA